MVTLAQAPMASPINDNKLHHVKLVKWKKFKCSC